MMTLMLALLASLLHVEDRTLTTWDEPWHQEVVKNADAFVLARVVSVDAEHKAAVCKVVRHLAGADVAPVFEIDGFSLLRIMSYSSNAPVRLNRTFHRGAELYLFLTFASDGRSYEIATPSSGVAEVDGDHVRAVYRHSYHLALVERGLYERTQVAFFSHLHEGASHPELMRELVDKYLRRPAHGVEADPRSTGSMTFFAQHAALETFYYFGSQTDHAILEPFLAAPEVHVRVSAVRALSRVTTPAAKRRQIEMLLGDADRSVKVQAVAALRRQNAREFADELAAALPKLTDEPFGFGSALMDPRIGTATNSPAGAARALLLEWRTSRAK